MLHNAVNSRPVMTRTCVMYWPQRSKITLRRKLLWRRCTPGRASARYKGHGWKIHRPGSGPACCFASIILYTETISKWRKCITFQSLILTFHHAAFSRRRCKVSRSDHWGQASPSRRPGLRVTWPGLEIFSPQKSKWPGSFTARRRWRSHCARMLQWLYKLAHIVFAALTTQLSCTVHAGICHTYIHIDHRPIHGDNIYDVVCCSQQLCGGNAVSQSAATSVYGWRQAYRRKHHPDTEVAADWLNRQPIGL